MLAQLGFPTGPFFKAHDHVPEIDPGDAGAIAIPLRHLASGLLKFLILTAFSHRELTQVPVSGPRRFPRVHLARASSEKKQLMKGIVLLSSPQQDRR
jgi:hypothetical protein